MPNFDEIKQNVYDSLIPMFNERSVYKHAEGTGKSLYNQVEGRLHEMVDIKPIIDFVTLHARLYWKELGYRNVHDVHVMHSWANINPPGGFITAHTHSPAPLAASFYVNATPEMGNLFLEHPLVTLLSHQPYNTGYLGYSNKQEVEVLSGKLVMFPGYINHWTGKNPTSETRMGLAFHITN